MASNAPSTPPPDAAPEPSNDVVAAPFRLQPVPPPLTPEQEDHVQEGLPEVYRCAREIARDFPRAFEPEDLLGPGTMGLMVAARTFDAEGDLDFIHHARGYIRGRMLNAVESELFTTRARVEHAMNRGHNGFVTHQKVDVNLFGDTSDTLRTRGDDGCDDALAAAFIAAKFVAPFVDAQSADPEEAIVEQVDLRRALATLAPPERQLIELVDGQDMSLPEAAKVAHIHPNTAQRRHARALERLSAFFLDEEPPGRR